MNIPAPAPAIYLAVSYDTLNALRKILEVDPFSFSAHTEHELENLMCCIEAQLQKRPTDTDVSDLL